jgi:glyoxylase-like metal-dependent hydrolase (beta-lactamase superfamily II)
VSGAPAVIGSREPWSGGAVTPGAQCVLAPNPSPMTLDGTNTWILGGAGAAVVIDPGPADRTHLAAVRAALSRRDLRPALILLTHGHADHSEGARLFAQEFGVPVRALDPRHRHGAEGLHDGDVVAVGDVLVEVVATPGHTSDSLCFYSPSDQAVLTGDTLLGRGTTVVAWPDGSLADYLASLRRLQELADTRELARVLPGHGPALPDPAGLLADYMAHRLARLEQVRTAVAAGAASPADLVAAVYEPLPPGVYPAALASASAQWEYLQAHGDIPPPASR